MAQEFLHRRNDNDASSVPQHKSAEYQDNRQTSDIVQQLMAKQTAALQLQGAEEEEELSQHMSYDSAPTAPVTQRQENNTGLPDNLKSGMENLSGVSLDSVKVHYNSPQPAAVQAHAYAQGTDIHIAPGQEQHLPHELGHVVQQAQGRVQPTTTVAGKPVNDNSGLETEATAMGNKAMQMASDEVSGGKNSAYLEGG
ncbi:MAG: DUF4157 domain-containing protein [Reinekea sp.]